MKRPQQKTKRAARVKISDSEQRANNLMGITPGHALFRNRIDAMVARMNRRFPATNPPETREKETT